MNVRSDSSIGSDVRKQDDVPELYLNATPDGTSSPPSIQFHKKYQKNIFLKGGFIDYSIHNYSFEVRTRIHIILITSPPCWYDLTSAEHPCSRQLFTLQHQNLVRLYLFYTSKTITKLDIEPNTQVRLARVRSDLIETSLKWFLSYLQSSVCGRFTSD